MANLELAGFVLRSEYRKNVFSSLESPIMPSAISRALDIRLTHITRELRYLKEQGLAECLNPNERMGRMYQLTTRGKKLKKDMEKAGLI